MGQQCIKSDTNQKHKQKHEHNRVLSAEDFVYNAPWIGEHQPFEVNSGKETIRIKTQFTISYKKCAIQPVLPSCWIGECYNSTYKNNARPSLRPKEDSGFIDAPSDLDQRQSSQTENDESLRSAEHECWYRNFNVVVDDEVANNSSDLPRCHHRKHHIRNHKHGPRHRIKTHHSDSKNINNIQPICTTNIHVCHCHLREPTHCNKGYHKIPPETFHIKNQHSCNTAHCKTSSSSSSPSPKHFSFSTNKGAKSSGYKQNRQQRTRKAQNHESQREVYSGSTEFYLGRKPIRDDIGHSQNELCRMIKDSFILNRVTFSNSRSNRYPL